MEDEELRYWLWWNRVPGVGPSRFYRLLNEYGSMALAWRAPVEELRAIIGDKVLKARDETATNWDPDLELRKLEHFKFRIYCQCEPDYPSVLRRIFDPPPVLYAWGGFETGDDVAIAVIGTRTPTPSGEFTAQELAAQLSRQGLTIVSGMARGIDAAAHRGALTVKGRTIAVLGSGLDQPYPPENRDLMAEIADHGAVISEFPLGTEPFAKNFPARNRIISGLSLGVVVVEAAHDSGSLITAGMALEQGREVFAVPGNIGSEGSKGPHKLIRQGAKLVENFRDILDELAIPQLTMNEISAANDISCNEAERKVLECLSREPIHVDQVLRRSGLASAELNSVLVQLELGGLVKRFPGQLYLRVK